MSTTAEKPRIVGPDLDLDGNRKVIARNDNHHTFEHIARTLSSVLPGVSLEQSHRIADQIHNSGQAIAWSGPCEPVAHYWELVDAAGLTMAPLQLGLTW